MSPLNSALLRLAPEVAVEPGAAAKLLVAAVVLLLLPVSQVSAARIVVGADCTLVQAINEANGETTGVGS